MSTIWRQSQNKPFIHFANASDFLKDAEIPQAIKDSYNDYIVGTNPTKLEVKDGYPQTTWSEDDETNGKTYKATYHERFAWGVMSVPLNKKQAPAQTQPQTETAQVATAGVAPQPSFSKSSPTERESLARIADLLEIIAQYFTDKGLKSADKL